MTYEAACARLYQLERRGVRLGLDRIVGAFREHRDPQSAFGSVLVAGTNGKGSVCAFAASCLQAAGYRTGLFTSPHLVDFRERMRVDGRMILREEVTDLVERIRGSIDRWHLSFFEATTLMVVLWFRDRGVEAAAVEVGLGGRLDATRPVHALVTVITQIGLDHVRILGQTRTSIAGEKAGILRSGVPTAVGVSRTDALGPLRARAEEVGSPFYERRRSLRTSRIERTHAGSRFRVVARTDRPVPSHELDLEIGLRGNHQVANATLALLALTLLPRPFVVGEGALVDGLRRVRWPGRYEMVSDRPRILCDVAHNPDGARSLVAALSEDGERELSLVIGMVDGKDHAGFLAALRPLVRTVHYCTPEVDRAYPAGQLAEIGAGLGLAGAVHATAREALDAAAADGAYGETILVTGSFFTVGEVCVHLRRDPIDPLWEEESIGSEGSA